VTKTMDGVRFGRRGFDWRKLAWAVALAALLGFITGLFTNFHEVSWAVFFIILYLEYRLTMRRI